MYASLLVALSQSISAANIRPDCKNFSADLAQMASSDQAVRSTWDLDELATAKNTPRFLNLTEIVDRENTRRLQTLLSACGWPARPVHSDADVDNAWLITQHADRDAALQKQVIGLIENAIAKGDTQQRQQLAFLVDRVPVSEGKHQQYGTQLAVHGKCDLRFQPYDNLDAVNARRARIGWPSLDVYKKMIYEHNNCPVTGEK